MAQTSIAAETLAGYLRRLKRALSELSEAERADILEETKEHVKSRLDSGAVLLDVLAALGPPEAYASRFLDEMRSLEAGSSQVKRTSLAWIARRVSLAAGAVVACGLLYLIGFSALTVLVMKPFHPDRTGVWIPEHGGFFIGLAGPQMHGREILGDAAYPAAIIAVIGCWLVGRWIVARAVRRLTR